MEVDRAAAQVTPLLFICSGIVKALHTVGQKLKGCVPSTVKSIGTECNFLHVALTQLLSFDWDGLSSCEDWRREQVTRVIDSIILGCTLALSVIEDYAGELQDFADSVPSIPEDQGHKAQVKMIWNENEAKNLLLQLRGYQSTLTSLLRAAQDDLFGDDEEFALDQAAIGTLLQYSRASRSRKPMSIRAMMEQASTYSSLSRGPSRMSPHEPNRTAGHAHRSATSSRSSRSLSPSSSIVSSYGRAMSPPTTDGYDSSVSGRATRRPRSRSTRKQRPAVLELQLEDPEEPGEVQYRPIVEDKKEKEHRRRSSLTIADDFTFSLSTAPPLPLHPHKDRQTTKPPASMAAYERAGRGAEGDSEPLALDDIEQSIDELTHDVSLAPSPPGDEDHDTDYHRPPLKPHSSSSSLRSQVSTLPRAARLRKQASQDKMAGFMGQARQASSTDSQMQASPDPLDTAQASQSRGAVKKTSWGSQEHSRETPPQNGPPPKVPPPPLPLQFRQPMSATSGDFARQGVEEEYAESASRSHKQQPQTQSVASQGQPREVDDQPRPRQRRAQRSTSDAARRGVTRFSMPPQPEEDEEEYSSVPSDESNTPPHTASSPLLSQSLFPREALRVSSPEPYYHGRQEHGNYGSRPPSRDSVRSYEMLHNRKMSQTSQGAATWNRSYDLTNTPRQSVSSSPSYGTATIYSTQTTTPRMTKSLGSGATAGVHSDETTSSAQGYTTPRGTAGVGPQVNQAYAMTPEQSAGIDDARRAQQAQQRPQYSVYPQQADRREDTPSSRPRSPLMDEKFSLSVKDMPQGSLGKIHTNDAETATQKSSSTEHSRTGVSTPVKELLDLGGAKKAKKPKTSLFKDMINEYRNMSSKWYMEPYREPEVRELEWPERSQSSISTRPSTSSSAGNANGSIYNRPAGLSAVPEQPSEGENAAQPPVVRPASSNPVNRAIHMERSVHQPLESAKSLQSARTMSPPPAPPKSSGSQTSSIGSRLSLDGVALAAAGKMRKKETEKKPKKPSLFGEILKEYKEMTQTWYASPYQAERAAQEGSRSGSVSTGRS